ncbi:MAG: DUF4136 domain-containing protein [Phycisphaerales bacterium]
MKKGIDMGRSAWILVAVAACAAGCTPTYRVHVNTYSDLAEPLSQRAPIYIAADPNSANPILRRQIASKVRDLLKGDGYHPTENAQAAAYVLTFEMGIDSQRVVDYTPIYGPVGGYYYGGHGRRFGWGMAYTTYVPYVDTVYTHWLKMRLYAAANANQPADANGVAQPSESKMVWLGEASLGMGSPEAREAANYLLAACIEYFGADTREWVTVAIREDDPRISGIATE